MAERNYAATGPGAGGVSLVPVSRVAPEMIGDGVNPLTTSQIPRDTSQRASGTRMDLLPQERADVERATGAAVSALGREAFTAMMERGRRMIPQEIVVYELTRFS